MDFEIKDDWNPNTNETILDKVIVDFSGFSKNNNKNR